MKEIFKSTTCYICELKYKPDELEEGETAINIRVRDHCHITGKYRGSTHKFCNLIYV